MSISPCSIARHLSFVCTITAIASPSRAQSPTWVGRAPIPTSLGAPNGRAEAPSSGQGVHAAGCTSPTNYCTGKANSAGGVASIGWSGSPTTFPGSFAVTVSNALPQKTGRFIHGTSGAAAIPFNNGTLCIQPPLVRWPALQLDASGAATQPIDITPAMVGTTRWYQFWYRDPANLDGTNVGLSDGLEVIYCY